MLMLMTMPLRARALLLRAIPMTLLFGVVSGCDQSAIDDEPMAVTSSRYETGSGDLVLIRSAGGSTHWTTIGVVPGGTQEEQRFVLPAAITGTRLYACLSGSNIMPSTSPSCEGLPRLGILGNVLTASGTPMYRCRFGRDYFISVDPNCEGALAEGWIGSASSASALTKVLNTVDGYVPGNGGTGTGEGGEGGGSGSGGGNGEGGFGAGGSL